MGVKILDIHSYYQILEERLMFNYDVERGLSINNLPVDLFAKLEMKNEKYFASKSATVWKVENFEYVYIKHYKKISPEALYQFQEFLKVALNQNVNPNSEHMSTTITGVIILDQITDELVEIIENIQKFKYRKTFALSLKGWADIRLIVVDLHSNRVISNKKGREVAKFYLPELEKGKRGLFQTKKMKRERVK